MFPPSLPADVKGRAFRSGNGELGILPADAPAFLAACRSDGVEVLSWELWVADHIWDIENNVPVPSQGRWCGGIPVTDLDVLAVFAGDGDAEETQRQLAAIDLDAEVQPEWLPHVRVNFNLDD
jgi:hypothetical protein